MMTRSNNQFIYLFMTVLLFGVLCSDCTCNAKTEQEKQQEELEKSMEELGENLEDVGENISKSVEGSVEEAMKGMEKALSGLQKDGKVSEPVNFRKLKEFIPESFTGMERTKHKGSTSGIGGLKASVAEGKFQDGDKSFEVKITDFSMGTAIMGAAASWAALSIDEESDEGYKRTTTFDGHKAMEECNTRRERCTINIIVAGRFIVSIEGRKVDMDLLKKFVRKMDLDELAKVS